MSYPLLIPGALRGASGVSVGVEALSEGWMIVPVTEVHVREPVRLVARMARIIAAAEARWAGR